MTGNQKPATNTKNSFAIKGSNLTFAATNNRIINRMTLKNLEMPLTKQKNSDIFKNFGGKENNTGSIEGQIAQLTERINQISSHLQENKKDFSTHRGLMQLVGKRKRLLNYLQKHNLEGYRQLIEKLGIRK
jgi:small subunit ribosomal protein S15